MQNLPLAEYGIALSSIVALVFIVGKFLKHLEGKDKSFTDVINNHLNDAKSVSERLIAANDKMSASHERLEGAINKLVDKL